MFIGFGKFKHRTWESVVDTDHQYLEWCLDSLDTSKFNIPESVLELYLNKFRNDEKSTRLVAHWKARGGKATNAYVPHYEASPQSEHNFAAQSLQDVQGLDTVVREFEEACLTAFGKFPYNRWDN